MLQKVKKQGLLLLGIVLGAIGGYFYWKWFGCNDSCAITSSPRNSSIYGAIMGGLAFSMFKPKN